MTAHKNDADVAVAGCRALADIAGLLAGKQAAVDAGAPAAIGGAGDKSLTRKGQALTGLGPVSR